MDHKETTLDDNAAYFSPHKFVEELMEDIGFANAPEPQKEEVFKQLMQQLLNRLMSAVDINVKDYEIEEINEKHPDKKEWEYLNEIIEISPTTQVAIIEEVNNFYTETVETYQFFNKN